MFFSSFSTICVSPNHILKNPFRRFLNFLFIIVCTCKTLACVLKHMFQGTHVELKRQLLGNQFYTSTLENDQPQVTTSKRFTH